MRVIFARNFFLFQIRLLYLDEIEETSYPWALEENLKGRFGVDRQQLNHPKLKKEKYQALLQNCAQQFRLSIAVLVRVVSPAIIDRMMPRKRDRG